VQKNIQKRILMITLTILFPLTIIGAVSAATYDTDTSLTLSHNSAAQGDQITCTAHVTREGTSTPVPSGLTVTFTADSTNIGSGTTDSNGYATCTYTVTSNTDRDIRANFAQQSTGGNTYRQSDDVDELQIEPTATSLTVNPTTTDVGNPVTLTARLTEDGDGWNGQTIHFFVDGSEVGTATTTGSSSSTRGTASLTYTPSTFGTKNIQAFFYGRLYQDGADYDYYRGSSSTTQTLTVNGIPTSLTVAPASGYKDGSTTLSATLTSGGTARADKTINFYIGGVSVGSGTTDSNGVATCTYNPITQNVGTYTGYITAIFDGDTVYLTSNGANTLTVDAIPTSLTVTDVTGSKNQTVNLEATLVDTAHGNAPVSGKTISFKVNGVDAGSATTDANGKATLAYPIDLVGGTYNIEAAFLVDTQYAGSTGTGSLKVNQSSIYVLTTVSKNNPTVGETITLTFKLGNKGPDAADDVVFTYVIPEGMEFVSLETEPGYPAAVYDPATRTITWKLGTVPILDPWLNINVKVLNAGTFNINPTVTTSTYDPTLGSSVQFATVNAVQVASAASNTVPMQNTGMPIGVLVLAVLTVLGGLIVPKRK
jgi:uncharacterized repeat protein (TIGR01451 family)